MLDHNSHLPFPPELLAKEAQALADKAEQSLASILLQGSTCSVRPHLAFLKLKHKVSYEQLARIARLLFKIFCNAKGDVATEARTASPLASVLQNLNKLPDCPPPGSEARLSIEWRPIYDALLRVQLRGASWEEYALRGGDIITGEEASSQHRKALLSLVRRARNFFAPSAAQEIMEELRPYLCPHEKSMYKAAALICKLLPDELGSAGGAGKLLQELAGVWEWVPNSLEWQLLWITLFSRMARHNTEEMLAPLQPLLPALMSGLLRLLDVPSGKSTPQKEEQLGWPADCKFLCDKGDRCKEETVKKYTRLIVFTICPQSASFAQLSAVLDYLRPFFHPLQEGGYTKCLDMLLKMMTLNFAKRLGFESATHRPKKPWRLAYKLTPDDRAAFTKLFLPLALTALASKDHSMSFGAAQALKDLAGISEAEVLPQLMQRVLSSMDNVMRPHEVQSAISLCGVVAAPMLRAEEGLEFMGQMLQLSLGGIDTNDPMKTMYTLNLFNALLSHMPLADPKDLPQASSKPEMLYQMQDWVSEVLERVFQLLQNVPPMKKGNPLRGHVQPLLRRFLDLLLCQLSPSLYAAALDKIARKTNEMFYPPAKEFVGYLLDAAVLASPAQALAKLVPVLVRRIVAGGGVLAGSESEVAYFTHLLGHAVVRGGDALLAHSAEIDEVLQAVALREEAGALSEEASVPREAHKLLRKTLYALLAVYPSDFRSAPPSKLNWDTIKDFKALCAPACVPAEAEITFQVPSSASQQRARELVTRWVTSAKGKIGEAGVTPAALRVAFGCLTACIRGGGSLFPPEEMEGGQLRGEGEEEDVEEDECVGLLSPVVLEDKAFGGQVRAELGQLLLTVCAKYALPDNPDVTTLEALLPLVSFFLASKGVWRKHAHLKSACNYNKGVHRFWDKGVAGSYSRRLLQLRAHALLAQRLNMGVMKEDATAGQLLDVLAGLCLHEYSLVRKKAQELLPAVLRRYPLAHTRLYSKILQRLRDPSSSKGVVSGVVYTIQKAEVLQRVARHWGLSKELVEGLLASASFDETKVQVRLAELWNQFVPYYHPVPFGGLAHPPALAQDPDVLQALAGKDVQGELAAGAQRLGQRRQRAQDTQRALVAKLRETMAEGMAESGGVHWRFAVLAAAALSLQVRRDSKLEQATAKQFMLGLNSDLLPLRQLCRAVLPLLKLSESAAASASSDNMDVDSTAPGGDTEMGESSLLSSQTFDASLDGTHAGPFIDPAWAGWNRPPRPPAQPSPPAAQFAAAAAEVMGQEGWLKGVLDKVAQDHRLSGDERAEMSKTAAAGMPLASAAVQNACARRWEWPRTSAAPLADSFSKDTMLLVEALLGAVGAGAVGKVVEQLTPMAENHSDREQQCAAAEVLAGMLRAGMEWPAAEGAGLKEKLAALVEKVLGNAPPDSVGVWAEALRFVACNRDPRRVLWLSKIVASLEAGPDATSSAQVRALKLQQALLMEQSWKGLPLARAVCGASKAMLGGGSKSVREEAGRGLVLVARATMPVERDGDGLPAPGSLAQGIAASPLLADWLPALLADLTQKYTTSTADAKSAEAVALRGDIEGVLYFFIHSSRLGQSSSCAALLRSALPLMLAVQEDSDREFAQVGKVALELAGTSLQQVAVAESLLSAAEEVVAQAASWRVRAAGLQVVREAAHAMVLHTALRDRGVALLDKSMGDAQLEVRTDAASCLAGLLRAMPDAHLEELIARAPKPKRRGAKANPDQSAEDKAAALVRRHAKVLAVAAAVMSAPTALPEWMPAAVEALCVLGNEDPVIRTSITKTVGDFRKSHQDVWEEVRMTWSEDQLRLVSECSGTQSYYS